MRPKALATFSATPSWGQSWRAISKVRAWRVSRLGEDLERLEAISVILFLAPWAAGPSPARSLRCGTKKPGPGGLHPEGRSAAEDGEGWRICFARNSALAEGEIRRPQPLPAERVGLKAAHNRGDELAMGFLAALCRREKKDRPDGRPHDPRPAPKRETRFVIPILMALPVSPFVRGRRETDVIAEDFGHIVYDVGELRLAARMLERMAVVGRSGF